MKLTDALAILLEGHPFTIQGEDLNTLVVHDNTTPPTQTDINTCIEKYGYREKRRAEYPPLADQLDAMWKGGQAASDMKASIDAVKVKYPKVVV